MIKLKTLLTELTQRQKELKKDYLFKQTKLHSSNKIPSFEEVWEELKRSDDFKHEMEWRIEPDHSRSHDIDTDATEPRAEAAIREDQYERYSDIVYQYEQLEGSWCWRNIHVLKTVDPRKLEQLGIYWAIRKVAAEAHWGKFYGKSHFDCTYEALIELNNVDWPGTIFARMAMSGGDDEQEIRFLKNAPLMVRKVKINKEEFFINNRRRA